MNKLHRIYRAFVNGFWGAYREVAPKDPARILELSINCDSSDAEAAIERLTAKIHKLEVTYQSLTQDLALRVKDELARDLQRQSRFES